jgi:hypothetical protein
MIIDTNLKRWQNDLTHELRRPIEVAAKPGHSGAEI